MLVELKISIEEVDIILNEEKQLAQDNIDNNHTELDSDKLDKD